MQERTVGALRMHANGLWPRAVQCCMQGLTKGLLSGTEVCAVLVDCFLPSLLRMEDPLSHICRGGARPTEAMVDAKKAELIAEASKHGVSVDASASPQLLQYYPPFAPSWVRLQDVALPVQE